jgi:hypothetical protein
MGEIKFSQFYWRNSFEPAFTPCWTCGGNWTMGKKQALARKYLAELYVFG